MSLGGPLHELAADVTRFANQWPLAAAELFGGEITRQVASVTGGDGYLSGWRELGTADVEVSSSPGAATVVPVGGAWNVLENGTRPHEVEAKGRALNTPHGPRRRVHVRGVPGRQVWARGASNADRVVMAATEQALGRIGA